MIETPSNPTPPPFVPPPSRKHSPMRAWTILAVGFLLLGGMLFVVSRMADGGLKPPPPPPPPSATDMAAMATKWPAIEAHAVAPARGPANAPFTMVEFGDFQCPYCAGIRPLVEDILRKNPTQVNLMFVHMTWPQHMFAIPAARAANAAAAQGKFWPMYDQLYSHSKDLEPGFYSDYAKNIGLDKAQFEKQMNADDASKPIVESTEFSKELGLNSTPTILLRDNKTGQITMYVGTDKKGKVMSDGTVKDTLGLNDLTAALPWATKKS